MQKWYVVQVLSSLEKRVKKTIEEKKASQGMTDLISDILVPTEKVSEVKQGEQRVSEKRLWPGYILIKMELTDDSWLYVKNTNGVINFLGGEKPQPLPPEEADAILSSLAAKQEKVVYKHKIQVGDRVKITNGVFANFPGTVQEVFHEKGRLNVLVSIFDRDTRVDNLEFWQVERVPIA